LSYREYQNCFLHHSPYELRDRLNGTLQDECLKTSWLSNLWNTRQDTAAWQREFNEERPRCSLGYQTPAEHARQIVPSPGSAPNCRVTPTDGSISQDVNVI